MTPGTQVVYADFCGYVTTPPKRTAPDPNTVWILTRDGMYVGLPADSPKLMVVSTLPPMTEDEQREARALNLLPKEPEVEPKLFLRTGFIRLGKGHNHPAGTFKILAGGLGEDKEELQQAVRSSGYKSSTHRLAVVSWDNGAGYFVIEVKK